MSKSLKYRIVAKVARALGYDFICSRPVDLRGKVDHPLEAIYLAGRSYCVVEVPLVQCRSSLGFAYGHGEHPYAATLRRYRSTGVSDYAGSALEAQHQCFQPATVGECLNLDLRTGNDWKSAAPHGRVLPWEKTSAGTKRQRMEQRLKKDNIQRGASLDVKAGTGLIGPVTAAKAEIEVQTLVKLYHSIERRGFQRTDGPDGDIFAQALVNPDGEIRFLVRKGTHRANVLDALDYAVIPLRFAPSRVVRLVEAEHWPHVVDGMYRLDEAIDIFTRIFEGRPFQRGDAH